MTSKQILQEGIRRAQEDAKKTGFKLNDIVVHPNNKLTWRFKEIDGDQAIVYLRANEHPTGQLVVEQLPLDGLFIFRMLYRFCYEVLTEQAEAEGKGAVIIMGENPRL